MNKVEYFKFEAAPNHGKKGLITPIFENFPENSMIIGEGGGSFNVLCARLMNLSYAQYLRFCRDVVGAEITGKLRLYPIALFENNQETKMFIRLLNARMSAVIWEREHPDWREHADYIRRKEEETARRTANVPNS